MSVSIEHVFPTGISFADGLQIKDFQPDAAINKTPFGPPTAMRYSTGVFRGYAGKFEDLTAGSTDIMRLDAFFELCPPGYGLGWIVESISETHRKLRCLGIGDGTQLCFVAPLLTGGSISEVFVDGVPETEYTQYSSTTLTPSDAKCNGDGGLVPSTILSNYTIAVATADSSIGYTAFKISPGSAVSDAYIRYTDDLAVVVGEPYTANVSFLAEVGTYELQIRWQDGSGYLSNDSTTLTVTSGGWTTITLQAAAPATTVSARIRFTRTHSSALPFYVGGASFQHGDLGKIFLPESSPMMINFKTAPAAGEEITISGTGYRMTKVRWLKARAKKQYLTGLTTPGEVSAVEVKT